MSEKNKFNCSSCGQSHAGWPALTYISPDNYNCLSENDKNSIGYLDYDFCVITHSEQVDRFIRCTLTQKVNDNCQDLIYGLWVSLSEKSFLNYKEHFKKEGGESGYFGWLSNDIQEYEFLVNIPMDVITGINGYRPELIPHEGFDHPFVRDYYNGISKDEAERRIANMLDGVSKIEAETRETEKKKWWKIWK